MKIILLPIIALALSAFAHADDLTCASESIVSKVNDKEVMRGRIIGNTHAVEPGKKFLAGLLLVAQPGWHTYSANPGDAGIATTIEWRLPTGFKAGKTHWPKSKTKKYADDILCNVFDNEVLLITEIVPPNEIPEGEIVIKANVGWSCGTEMFSLMPIESQVVLNLKRGDSKLPANAELFSKHLALAEK